MYAILGANGRAGGEVARALIEQGEQVRVILRNAAQGQKWIDLGAEVAVANIEDIGAMTTALSGVDGAFLLNPPPQAGDPLLQTERQGALIAAAATRARLEKAVILSSIGAQHPTGTGVIATLHRFEHLMGNTAPATVFLRAGYFVETWGEVLNAVLGDGVLPSFIALEQKIPMVSTIDIGKTAADLLRDSWTSQRIVELTGPADWSASDVAEAFSAALGHRITPVLVPPQDRLAALVHEGVPSKVAEALLGMYDGIASGLVSREQGHEHRRGATTLPEAVVRLAEVALV